MKIIKSLKFAGFAALTALAVALLFQTSITRAGDKGKKGDHAQRGGDKEKGDREQRDATVTFTKWVTAEINQPGLLETLEGVVGGDIGDGTFTGEVLKETVTGDLDEIVAFYHFNGSKHSFSAIVHLDFDLISLKSVVIGVVTDGWL